MWLYKRLPGLPDGKCLINFAPQDQSNTHPAVTCLSFSPWHCPAPAPADNNLHSLKELRKKIFLHYCNFHCNASDIFILTPITKCICDMDMDTDTIDERIRQCVCDKVAVDGARCTPRLSWQCKLLLIGARGCQHKYCRVSNQRRAMGTFNQ